MKSQGKGKGVFKKEGMAQASLCHLGWFIEIVLYQGCEHNSLFYINL